MSVIGIGRPAPGRAADPTLRGVLAMLAAMACFAGNDAFIKLTAAHLPASQIMVLRGAMALLIVLAVIRGMGHAPLIRRVAQPRVIVRSLLEAGVAVTFITALARLGLAEITTILQATPLALTVLSVVFCGVKVGWGRWLAIGVGFAGVLLVVRPSADGLTFDAALALASAVLIAARDLVTRGIPNTTPSLVVTLGATMGVVAVGAVMGAAAPGVWVAPTLVDLLRLVAAAALLVMGNIAIVVAFRSGDMMVVGPFRYSVILWSLLLGALVWGDRPDAVALAGAALIVGSGLYALRRPPATPAAGDGVAP